MTARTPTFETTTRTKEPTPMPRLELRFVAEPPAEAVGANRLAVRAHPQQDAPQSFGNVGLKIEVPADGLVVACPTVLYSRRLRDTKPLELVGVELAAVAFEVDRYLVAVTANGPDTPW